MLARPGLRVVRGPDWSLGNEDGGEGHVGTVSEISEPGVMVVKWDKGTITRCRVGQMGKYDLRVIDNAQVGIIHPTVSCDACQNRRMRGMRYKCTICNNYDLCYMCYHGDKHDLSHPFRRFDSPRLISFFCEGVDLPPREKGRRCILSGIFADAKVVRGLNWECGNQDGGEGKMGSIVKICDWSHSSGRSAAMVYWDSDFMSTTYTYRRGYNGMCDIKLVKASSGGTYYPEHLPVLGDLNYSTPEVYRVGSTRSERLPFTVGDKVYVAIAIEQQHEHGGYNPRMAESFGKVLKVSSDGDVQIKLDRDTTILNSQSVRGDTSLNPTVDVMLRASNPTECLVCSEITEENVKLEPCGHKPACEDCSAKIKKCLICSKFVQKRVTKDKTTIPTQSPQQSAEMMRYLEIKIAEIEERYTCSICMDEKRNVVFLCGHGTCKKCADTLRTCHICRKTITNKIDIF